MKKKINRILRSGMAAILLLSVLLLLAPLPRVEAEAPSPWHKTPSATVLAKGSGAAWDNGGVGTVSVILDGGTYKMWYTGYDSTNGLLQVGYAISLNGKAWTRQNGGNPVLSPSGAQEAQGVGAPRVILDGGTYKMWYTGYNDSGAVPQIFYATSADGISWNRQNGGNPVLTSGGAGAFDERGVHSAAVIKDGTTFKMWYTGRGGSGFLGVSKIGYATSNDGVVWTRNGGTGGPVLSGDAGTWYADGVAVPSVVKTDKYYMWFSGYSGFTRGTVQVKIGAAESNDGITWTKTANAVVDKAASGWSAGGVGAPWVMDHGAGGAYEMWYSGVDINLDSQVGYAVTGNQTLTLTAVLQGDSRLAGGYNIPLTFKVYDTAVTNLNIKTLAYVAQFSTTTGNVVITETNPGTKTITFTVTGVPAGTFYVTLYSPHALVNLKNNAGIPLSGGGSFSMGTLLEGDAQDIGAGSVVIDFSDFIAFANAYETQSGMANWNANADFDRSGWVKIADFGLLYMNYSKTSPQTI